MSPTYPPPPTMPDEWQTVPLEHLELSEREAIRLALTAALARWPEDDPTDDRPE